MINLEFIASDTGARFTGQGETFLQAAISLLQQLTVYVEVDERVYEALAEAREEDEPCVIEKCDFSDPEAGFTITRS